MKLRPHQKVQLPAVRWDTSSPLFQFSANPADTWTLADSHENIICFGSTGSGKTSSVGTAYPRAQFRMGSGALVLCAKPGEAARVLRIAEEEGCADRVVVMDASARFRFNFLNYLLNQPAAMGGGRVDNVVHIFMQILMQAHAAGRGMGEGPDFWMKSARELLFFMIGALYHAYGTVRLDDILKFLNSLPSSPAQKDDANFRANSFCFQTLQKDFLDPAVDRPEREALARTRYFGNTIGLLDQKTLSNLRITLSAELSPLLAEPLNSLLCTDTNIIPDITFHGAIIILDMPLKVYDQAGWLFQMIVKFIWQKACERRQVNETTRTVCLIVDEAHFFVSEYDAEFLSTSRAFRVSVLFLTQSIVALYTKVGGRHPENVVDALLGNFQTKVLFSTSCQRTAQWFANAVGKTLLWRDNLNWSEGANESRSNSEGDNWSESDSENQGSSISSGISYSHSNGNFSGSSTTSIGRNSGTSNSRSRGGNSSYSESRGVNRSRGGGASQQMDYILQPAFFSKGLRQGGPRNNYLVDGIVMQSNRNWSQTGDCFIKATFNQKAA